MLLHLNERSPREHLEFHSIDFEDLDVLAQLIEAAERSDVSDEVESAQIGQGVEVLEGVDLRQLVSTLLRSI